MPDMVKAGANTEGSMSYQVTIDFKRGPSFGPLPVIADDRSQAREKAKSEAIGYGFDAPIKKVTVREA
jgi:hypothetical protein